MPGPLRRTVRRLRRLALGRLGDAGDMFDAISARLSEITARRDTLLSQLGVLSAKIDAQSSAVDTRLDALSAQLDALRSARMLSPGSAIDYQIETARYYLRSAIGDIAPGFKALYERCKDHTVASAEQLHAVNTAVDYILRRAIEGDIVDCGAGHGGTAMMAALTLAGGQRLDRRIVLFDSFAELPAAADGDAAAGDRAAAIRELLAATGYPTARIEIVSGLVERTVPQFAAGAIAFLRIDTESYTATKAVLETLSPRLAAGAVLLINDSPGLLGPHQAIHDYFGGDGKLPLFNRIDYCTRVAVWPG